MEGIQNSMHKFYKETQICFIFLNISLSNLLSDYFYFSSAKRIQLNLSVKSTVIYWSYCNNVTFVTNTNKSVSQTS